VDNGRVLGVSGTVVVGVTRETYPGECRVALVPAVVPVLARAGLEVVIEAGAGQAAGYGDVEYLEKGARALVERASVFEAADVVTQVLCHGANDRTGHLDLPLLRPGQVLVGFLRPLESPRTVAAIAERGVTALAVELIPRTTRAQAMDVLSAMATVCGYKAVLLAASTLPRMFPMLMTAAGTVTPARVLVIGAGVAGLQAIAAARRLGSVVWAYDVRPAAREQVLSVGGRFLELPLETAGAEDSRGYARALDESFYRRQREVIGEAVRDSDVVIATAVVPGRRAPLLITADMVAAMRQGSVIVDLTAERGGNCELTRAGETVVSHGVTIFGAVNLASTVAWHSSQMYGRTVSAFLLHFLRNDRLVFDEGDEIARETLVARGGAVVHPRVLEALREEA
jgi:NAD(P) transhydrogenase subunit alpha